MEFIERLEIENACSRLVLGFNMGIDSLALGGETIEQMINLFSEDGKWFSLNGQLNGHTEMRAYLTQYPKQVMAHISSNIVVDVIDSKTAKSVSYFMFFGSRQEPFTNVKYMGKMEDDFVKTEKGWKIASHRSLVLFKDPAYTLGSDPVPYPGS